MSALADHPFVKMNGLGNEIVLVDMRAAPRAVTADDARAAAPHDLDGADSPDQIADETRHVAPVGPPTEAEVRAGFARIAASLTGG